MTTLFKDIRTAKNIFAAWRHVKRSAMSSKSKDIRKEAQDYEINFHSHNRKIASKLRKGNYVFQKSKGILGDKAKRSAAGKEPRPIVLSPMENRVVQRAILQVLQPRKIKTWKDGKEIYEVEHDKRLGLINEINKSKYGVGGLLAPHGGVKKAVNFISDAITDGYDFYYQTDIESFFVNIPVQKVVDIIFEATKDEQFCSLFRTSMDVELENVDELQTYRSLFPHNGKGVAQGSSLSAFAGNVLLYEFDHKLNSTGVMGVRYIDDIFVVAKTDDEIGQVEKFCRSELSQFNLKLYKVTHDANAKAKKGKCCDGIELLGCFLQPGKIAPSSKSKANLIKNISGQLSASQKEISKCFENGSVYTTKQNFSKTLSNVADRVYGWQKAFSFCTDIKAFIDLDKKINDKILKYMYFMDNLKANQKAPQIVKALGISSTEELQREDIKKAAKAKLKFK